jgi:hypothetical protein
MSAFRVRRGQPCRAPDRQFAPIVPLASTQRMRRERHATRAIKVNSQASHEPQLVRSAPPDIISRQVRRVSLPDMCSLLLWGDDKRLPPALTVFVFVARLLFGRRSIVLLALHSWLEEPDGGR